MIYPLVTDLAVDGIPVAVTCRVLGFSTQAFYAWKPSRSPAGTSRTLI
jgi:putative transposase